MHRMDHCYAAYFIDGTGDFISSQELGKNQKDMAETLEYRQVVLNRWETGARKGHQQSKRQLLRLSYFMLQNDEYTHAVNGELREKLFRYFGRIKHRAAPPHMQIDPNRCEPQEIIQKAFIRS